MLSPLESNIDPPSSGSVKVSLSLSGGGEELLLSNRVLLRSGEDPESSLISEDEESCSLISPPRDRSLARLYYEPCARSHDKSAF